MPGNDVDRIHDHQVEHPRKVGTTLARLGCSERTARRVADLLAESLDPDDTAVAARQAADGGWIVEAYFRTAPDRQAVRGLVALAADEAASRELTFDTVAEKDWVAAGLEALEPVAAGRFLVHGRHDRARVAINRIGIEIEAALAFGTGHHGTTRGCLLALDRILKARRPQRVLDVGTGSGVLAIAAGKAARCRVLAGDVDRRAVRVAAANARANGVGAIIEVVSAAGLIGRRFRERAPFDLVLANILLHPLERLAAPMKNLAAPNARVVLSGLLPAQASAALAAYRAQGFGLERRIPLDGWVTLVLVRRAPHGTLDCKISSRI